MNSEGKSGTKRIITFFIFLVVLFFISQILGTIVSIFISDPKNVKINIATISTNLFSAKTFKLSIIIFIALAGMLIYYLVKFGYFGMFKMINREDRAKSKLHGASRWQTPAEMAKNFGEKESKNSYHAFNYNDLHKTNQFHGFIINSFKKNSRLYLESIKDRHCMVVGSTGSGKTTSFISPTIVANSSSGYKASMLIYDLKGDLFKKHQKTLEQNGYTVLVINLKDPIHSVRFNPLALIWDLYHEYLEAHENGELERETELSVKVSNYISDISTKIVPTATGENKVWSEGSQGIIKGLLWGMLEDSSDPKYDMTKDKFTFAQLGNILNRQKDELFEFLTNRDRSSMVFAKAGMIIGNDSEKTVASYLSNTQTSLDPFLEKSIEIVTATSDFDLRDLPEKPHAIFIAIDDTNTACHAICSVLTVQVRNYLVLHADMNGGSLDRTFYFLLDEFANLPKIENFNHWMSTDRSRKLFYCIMLQSISQLKNIFNETEAKEIRDNCDLQVFMKCNEVETAKYFQELFCKYTAYARSGNISTTTLQEGVYQGTSSLTSHELINLDELLHIQMGNIYFHFGGLNPCKATLVPFYDTELQELGIFTTGYTKSTKINTSPKFEETYYNLMLRRAAFEHGEPMPKSKPSASNEGEEGKIKKVITNITDETIAEPPVVATVPYSKLQEALALKEQFDMNQTTKKNKPDPDDDKGVTASKENLPSEEESSEDFLLKMKNRKAKALKKEVQQK